MRFLFQEKNIYRRNIQVNYIYWFFECLNFTRGFWMLYLFSKGMTLVQLGILEGVFHITSFLMETPTGVVADLFGRKASRIIGRLIMVFHLLLLIFGTSFTHFLLAFILCAISWNLESGAGDAFVYDSLLENKEEDEFMKVNGRNEVIMQGAQALGLVIGGWIALRSYEVLFSVEILATVLCLGIALFFKETTVGRVKISEKPSLLSCLKSQYVDSFKIVKGNNRLIYMIVFMNALGAFATTAFFYMQIYCNENGVQEGMMGIILALSCVFAALGGLLAYKIEGAIKERNLLLALPIAYMLIMWCMVEFKSALFAFMAIGFFDSVLFVVYTDYINKIIPSDKRATLLSFSSMVFSFFMISVFPVFGIIGEHLSLSHAFGFLAVISTILVGINLTLLLRPQRGA